MPQNVQKVNQAQRDFVNAVLRQESGAAIADSEFENAKKQYFPQPGDKPEVIEQKRQNRERVISSFETNAGPAGYTVRGQGGGGGATPPAAAPSGAPQVGTVEHGYVFLGGDPSKPASWRKQ
jgi:hypothetical protein